MPVTYPVGLQEGSDTSTRQLLFSTTDAPVALSYYGGDSGGSGVAYPWLNNNIEFVRFTDLTTSNQATITVNSGANSVWDLVWSITEYPAITNTRLYTYQYKNTVQVRLPIKNTLVTNNQFVGETTFPNFYYGSNNNVFNGLDAVTATYTGGGINNGRNLIDSDLYLYSNLTELKLEFKRENGDLKVYWEGKLTLRLSCYSTITTPSTQTVWDSTDYYYCWVRKYLTDDSFSVYGDYSWNRHFDENNIGNFPINTSMVMTLSAT